MAKKDEIHLSHENRSETVDFIFSADKFDEIKITMVLHSKYENRHVEVEHKPMDCLVDKLIKWLQEKRCKT
jgi:hypothetical protein